MTPKLLQMLKIYLCFFFAFIASLVGPCFYFFPLLPIALLSPRLYCKLASGAIACWFYLCIFIMEDIWRVKIKVFGDLPPTQNERVLLIMNHLSNFDWFYLWTYLARFNVLKQIKFISKDSLRSFPGFGWSMQYGLFIFLKRNWNLDKKTINLFMKFYHLIKMRFWLLIFPEGTNLSPESKAKSDDYAKKNGLMPLKNCLLPHTTGFCHIIENLYSQKNVDCVCDLTVSYPGDYPVNPQEFFNGSLPSEVHFYCRVVSLDSIFNENTNPEKWLMQTWRDKDEFLQRIKDNGVVGLKPIPVSSTYKTMSRLVTFLWGCTLALVFYFLYTYRFFRYYFYSILFIHFVFQTSLAEKLISLLSVNA